MSHLPLFPLPTKNTTKRVTKSRRGESSTEEQYHEWRELQTYTKQPLNTFCKKKFRQVFNFLLHK
ncbi:MAG TPA: hypothetical protein DCE42_06945 [Myxococcales bacterium]|nr:hypothetical protein [Myxococcales bacterium]